MTLKLELDDFRHEMESTPTETLSPFTKESGCSKATSQRNLPSKVALFEQHFLPPTPIPFSDTMTSVESRIKKSQFSDDVKNL